MKTYLSICLLSLFMASAHGAVILKTKNNKALVHLEGLKTRKGAYLEVLDLYGKPRGLVQIKKVGDKKAIGILKVGQMKYKWSLEPKSKGFALSKLKPRKKRARRGLASSGEEQYLVDENQLIQDNYGTESSYTSEAYPTDSSSSFIPSVTVGIKPEGSLNLLSLHSDNQKLIGLGFGGSFFVEAMINAQLSTEAYVGYKHFSANAEVRCGDFIPCSLTMDYVVGGINLKTNLFQKNNVRVFAGVDGALLYPFKYANQANLTKQSFGLHGTLGVLFGAEFYFGNIVLPIIINTNLMIPPTSTTLIGTSNLQIGLGYQF